MATANTETVECVIAAQFFRYTKLVQVPGTDSMRPVMATARRGDTVQVLVFEAERGRMFGAFHGDAAVTTDDDGETVVELDVREMSDAELASWIKTDRPTGSEVVDLADGDATLAERLLNAERTATNGKPRQIVTKGLTSVMDKAVNTGAPGEVRVEPEGTP